MITGRISASLDVRVTEKEGEKFIDVTPWHNGYGNGCMTFNKEQVFLIELYLNEIDYNEKEEWDGCISVTVGKKEQKIAFRTPEDVWEAIQKFK